MSLFQAFQHPTFQETMSKKARNAVTKFFEVYQQFHDKFKEDIELSQKIHDYLLEIGYLTGLKRIYPNHEEAVGRQENVMEFINAAASFEDQFDDHSLQDYMEANSLLDDMDNSSSDDDEEENGVNLMTVHASKGLEFPVVILVGLEQKLFPHERSIQDRDVDEERRLFYVAVTRAKHHLFITRSKLRAKFNMRERTIPSQFVLEIPEDVIEEKRLGELFRAASKNEVEDQLAQLKAMLQRKQSGK